MATLNTNRKRLYEKLSCITIDADSGPHELKDINYFDVPDECYTAGNLRGARLVCELLAVAASEEGFDFLPSVMREAIMVIDDQSVDLHIDAPSKVGAAVGFKSALQDVFIYASKRLNFSGVFAQSFAYYEEEQAKELKKTRRKNARALAAVAAVKLVD